MLETILTRIILRYANRYICDTFHTDTFSLWGGDLVVRNFELRTDELIRALGGSPDGGGAGLRFARGFVRELRVHVPWNAIRSQSLRIEVDAVEVVFSARPGAIGAPSSIAGGDGPVHMPPSAPSTPSQAAAAAPVVTTPSASPQEGLDEASETWLQPLLQTIFGNAVVAASNVVAKAVRNGVTGCVTVGGLGSRPLSSRFEPGFVPIAGPRPILYRSISVRDITVTLDQASTLHERRHTLNAARRAAVRTGRTWSKNQRYTAALPVLHRVSVEVLLEWPLLPWPGPVTPLPASHVEVHLSPVRARLSTEQLQLVASLFRQEVVLRPAGSSLSGCGQDVDADSNSDKFSLRSLSGLPMLSEPSTSATDSAPSTLPGADSAGFGRHGITPLVSPPATPGHAAGPTPSTMAAFRQQSPAGAAGHVTSPFGGVPADAGAGGSAAAVAGFVPPSRTVSGGALGPPTIVEEPSLSPSLPTKAKRPDRTGITGFLTSVLLDDDEDEDDDEQDIVVVPKETRRFIRCSASVPILALTVEQLSSRDSADAAIVAAAASGSPLATAAAAAAAVALREGATWVGTLSLIGLSAFVAVPPKGERAPMEGSLELHHIALQVPGDAAGAGGGSGGAAAAVATAFCCGSALARSPLEADEPVPPTEDSVARARAWALAGRRILAAGVEFPHPSHCALGGVTKPPASEATAEGAEEMPGSSVAAVRVGVLGITQQRSAAEEFADGGYGNEESPEATMAPSPSGAAPPASEAAGEVYRFSVQLAEAALRLEPGWCRAFSEVLQPLGGLAAAPPGPEDAAQARAASAARSASGPSSRPGPAAVVEAVICSAGVSLALGEVLVAVGPARVELRSRQHGLDEAQLAAALSETTVFTSSVLAHLCTRPARGEAADGSEQPPRSLVYVRIPSLSATYTPGDSEKCSAERLPFRFVSVEELVCVVAAQAAPPPLAPAPSSGASAPPTPSGTPMPMGKISGPSSVHIEVAVARAQIVAALSPLLSLLGSVRLLATPSAAPEAAAASARLRDTRRLTVEAHRVHMALQTMHVGTVCVAQAARRTQSSPARRNDFEAFALSSSESEEEPLESFRLFGSVDSGDEALRARQALLVVRRACVTYSDSRPGGVCAVLAQYDLSPHAEVAQEVARTAGEILADRTVQDTTLSVLLQSCPAALPDGYSFEPPPLELFLPPPSGAFKPSRLSGQRHCALLWLNSMHVELNVRWISFMQSIVAALSPPGRSGPEARSPPSSSASAAAVAGRRSGGGEALASAALCAVSCVCLPAFVWLTSPADDGAEAELSADRRPEHGGVERAASSRATACAALPLIVAEDSHLQASGLRVAVFQDGDPEPPARAGAGAAPGVGASGGRPWASSVDQEMLCAMPRHSIAHLRQCLALLDGDSSRGEAAAASAGERGLSGAPSTRTAAPDDAVSSTSGQALLSLDQLRCLLVRRESKALQKPEVAVSAQLDLSPLRCRLRPAEVRSLLLWAQSLGEQPPQPPQPPQPSCRSKRPAGATRLRADTGDGPGLAPASARPALHRGESLELPPSRLRVAVVATAHCSVEASLEGGGGSLELRVPCISVALQHVADSTRPRVRLSLRMSRPHLVLAAPSERPFDIVEWCEEKVCGDPGQAPLDSAAMARSASAGALRSAAGSAQRRSASWLNAGVRWRGLRPPEVTASSLPLGLCVALVPLLNVFAVFAATAVPLAAPSPAAEDTEDAGAGQDGAFAEVVEPHTTRCNSVEEADAEDLTGDRGPEAESTAAPLPPAVGGGRGLSAAVSLGAVSLRLFARSPFDRGAVHLSACVAEASAQCSPTRPVRAQAVVSLSLFEQVMEAPDSEAIPRDGPAPPTCLVDDLLRPCSITFCEGSVVNGVPEPSRLEVNVVGIEITSRSHFCLLTRLVEEYAQGASEAQVAAAALAPRAPASEAPAPRSAPQARRSSSRGGREESAGGAGCQVRVRSVMVALPGPDEEVYKVEASELLVATSTEAGSTVRPPGAAPVGVTAITEVSVAAVRAALAGGRHSVEVLQVKTTVTRSPPTDDVEGLLDIVVSVDGGVSAACVTGRIADDLARLVPSAAERAAPVAAPALAPPDVVARAAPERPVASAPEARKAGGELLKWRLIVSSVAADLAAGAFDDRRVAVRMLNFSIFSWPETRVRSPAAADGGAVCAVLRKRLDISVEAIDASSGHAGAMAPLIAPLSVQGSVATATPELRAAFRTRTEVDFRMSPMQISAGAWQLRLVSDIAMCTDPSLPQPPSTTRPVEDAGETTPEQVQSRPIAAGEIDEHLDGGGEVSLEAAEVSTDMLTLELRVVAPSGGRTESAGEDLGSDLGPAGGVGLPLSLVCGVPAEELLPWQAVRVPSEATAGGGVCPVRYVVRLDRAMRVKSVAVRSPQVFDLAGDESSEAESPEPRRASKASSVGAAPPEGFRALSAGSDFRIEAWDDVRRCFVDITDMRAEDAVCSHLIALRLPALVGFSTFCLLVQVAALKSTTPLTELTVSVATPRLTWSVLHSAVCCGTAPMRACAAHLPTWEEPIADVSFLGFQFSMWQASKEGMALSVSSQRVAVDVHDLATLSLVQVVPPDDNHVSFHFQNAQAEAPTSLPLLVAPHRRSTKRHHTARQWQRGCPTMDLDFASWRLALPPWALARVAHLGQSLAQAWSFDPLAKPKTPAERLPPARRLPVVVRNALPVPLVFGQRGAGEALAVSSGAERAYVWRRSGAHERQLSFALRRDAPWSAPLAVDRERGPTWVELRIPVVSGDAEASGQAVLFRGRRAAAAGSGREFAVHVCLRQISRAQCCVTLLPPVLILSHLPWEVEFKASEDEGLAHFSANSILSDGEYLEGLPIQNSFQDAASGEPRAAEGAAAVEGGDALLRPGRAVGVLTADGSAGTLQFRRPSGQWGVQLPLPSPRDDPFATLLSFRAESLEGPVVNSMCTSQDLWAMPRGAREAVAKESRVGAARRPAPDAVLPVVLQLWPLLRLDNRSAFNVSLGVSPLGAVAAGPWESAVLETGADPRQVRTLQLQVFGDGPGGGVLSTGPLLLSGLTQFPHTDVDELVSLRNSVRCAGEANEMHFLVEVRRCRLSSVLRSIIVEPMWSILNETGQELLLSAVAEGPAVHVAPLGESASACLGAAQHDPTFPFAPFLGVRPPEGGDVVWCDGQLRCPMGQTTRVEIPCGPRRFVALVSVALRRPAIDGGEVAGGVRICIFAGAYVRSDVAGAVELSLGSGESSQVLRLEGSAADAAPAAAPLPWPWWPSASAVLVAEAAAAAAAAALAAAEGEGEDAPPSAKAKEARAKEATLHLSVQLVDDHFGGTSRRTEVSLELVRSSGASAGVAAVSSLAELLGASSTPPLCGGHARDVCLDIDRGHQRTVLLNVSYQLRSRGCCVLAILRSQQPPLVCANMSNYSVWVGEPWRGRPPAQPMMRCWRVPPGATVELPCALLRSLEVFAPGCGFMDGDGDSFPGSDTPGEGEDSDDPFRVSEEAEKNGAAHAEVVQARLALDPEGEDGLQLDIALTEEDDVRWTPTNFPPLLACTRYSSGICRVELRCAEGGSFLGSVAGLPIAPPPALPMRGAPLPIVSDFALRVSSLVVHLIPGSAARELAFVSVDECRSLALHAAGVVLNTRAEQEALESSAGRRPSGRSVLELRAEFISVADVGRSPPAPTVKQVAAVPSLHMEVWTLKPPYDLPASFELVRASLHAPKWVSSDDLDGDAQADAAIVLCLDDSLLHFVQPVVGELSEEFAVDACTSTRAAARDRRPLRGHGAKPPELPPIASEEFRYLFLGELTVSPLPLHVDLQLSSPVFVSFTGLALTFPEVRLSEVSTTSYLLGQELIAHCIAFLLLNSPVLLGSCDLLGNPVQVYRHLQTGLSDLLQRPLREGAASFARHLSSASLASVSAVSDSLRRNLPTGASPAGAATALPAGAHGAGLSAAALAGADSGLAAGLRALVEGVGRGLGGVVRWDSHTPPPERAGALGVLRGARRAVAGAVAHPIGGLLDFVTAAARGWQPTEGQSFRTGPHSAGCTVCLKRWHLRLLPDVSPLKFHLQSCQGLPVGSGTPAVLFWSARCELVRVGDGPDGTEEQQEPNLKLIRAGLLLTSSQICVLLDGGAAHVLDVAAVQAAEEVRGRPSALLTIAGAAGRIWQLHVRTEPGEFIAHLRRAQRLLGLPPDSST